MFNFRDQSSVQNVAAFLTTGRGALICSDTEVGNCWIRPSGLFASELILKPWSRTHRRRMARKNNAESSTLDFATQFYLDRSYKSENLFKKNPSCLLGGTKKAGKCDL
jgi:hypothetical protein